MTQERAGQILFDRTRHDRVLFGSGTTPRLATAVPEYLPDHGVVPYTRPPGIPLVRSDRC
jgi:hypothetical protein